MDKVKAKFKVDKVTDMGNDIEIVHMWAVTDDGIPENARFHKYTPGGEVSITIDNPAIVGFFQEGKEYYIDFTPADTE